MNLSRIRGVTLNALNSPNIGKYPTNRTVINMMPEPGRYDYDDYTVGRNVCQHYRSKNFSYRIPVEFAMPPLWRAQ